MSVDIWVRKGHPIIFGLLIVLGIVELSISASLTSLYNKHHNYPRVKVRDATRFILFSSTWTVVFSLAFLGLFLHSADGSVATSIISHLIFFTLTWIFWSAGVGAITDALNGGNNCSKIKYNLPYCNQLNALEGFAWAEWIVTTLVLLVIVALATRSVRRGIGYRGPLTV
ncbi:uncharacterized protein EI90DRAFT_1945660 [Cantharellus anzutake]|uniref:uncharacterized protein n=1 Tax=Cantharellus anzutake TaxID=1750568 RepID=UPI0019043730|nr:uncharacterized protein EI90DRAFT_1945660 [Cantharellus anzutake]KAF8326367.1 hypothetical protein EI90DRAFT_1945660 [Cantharellus anzutake]